MNDSDAVARWEIDRRDIWIDAVADAVLGANHASDSDRIRILEMLFNSAGNPTFYDV